MDEPIQIFHFVINGFYVFGNKFFFEKKNKYYIISHFFSFLSNCYLVLLLSGHIIHYRCPTKVQSNNFCGPNYGFTASEAFSGKF